MRPALLALAAAVCAVFGYDFGVQIGGKPTGFVAAASSALFGWLLVSGLVDQALRLVRKLRPPG